MNSLKKLFLIAALATVACGFLFAEEQAAAQDAAQETKPFSLDAGAGLSFGLMQEEGEALEGIALFLSTLRGGAYLSGQYEFAKGLSAGLRLGVYTITYSSGEGEDKVSATLVDLPIHALIRYKIGFFAVEGFGGYYIPLTNELGGFEAGGRLYLGPVYGGVSAVFAPLMYTRVEVGVNLSLFNF
jgi:hypothetical protein